MVLPRIGNQASCSSSALNFTTVNAFGAPFPPRSQPSAPPSPTPQALRNVNTDQWFWHCSFLSEVWHEVYRHDRAHEEHEQDGKRQNAVDGPEADDNAAREELTTSESERLQSRQAAEALGGAGAPQRREQRHQSSSRYYPRAVVFPFLVNFLQGRPTQSVTLRPR